MNNKLFEKIWKDENTINPKVRLALLKIADTFIKFTEIDIPIKDVCFVGSMANYDWTEQSDIDLHIMFDFSVFGKQSEMVKELLMSKKSLWNYDHDIKMFGHVVEVYPEDVNDKQQSTGKFSLVKNLWIIKPKIDGTEVDKKIVLKKVKDITKYVDFLENKLKDNKDNEELIEKIEQLMNSLREKRKAGLIKNGLYSVENLVYKMLRNKGYLDKLHDLKIKAFDTSVTLEIKK
jgi:predicted nucleotidyltransferase